MQARGLVQWCTGAVQYEQSWRQRFLFDSGKQAIEVLSTLANREVAMIAVDVPPVLMAAMRLAAQRVLWRH